MRASALAFAFFLSTATLGSAQSYIGAGGISCSEVIRLTKGSSTPLMIEGYAQGYISGMAAAIYVQSKSQQDILGTVPAKEPMQFIDFYCGENRGKTLLNASNAYLTYLGRSRRQ